MKLYLLRAQLMAQSIVLLSLRSQMLNAQIIIAQLQRRKIRRKYADGLADAPVQNQRDVM